MVLYMKLSRYIRGSREHTLYVQELFHWTILSAARHFRIGCPPIIQYKYGVRFRVFYKLFFIIFFSRRSPLWMLSWTVLTEVPSIFAMSDCFVPVCTDPVSGISPSGFQQDFHHLIRQSYNIVFFVYFRVKFPQINFSHDNPTILIFWLNRKSKSKAGSGICSSFHQNDFLPRI